MKILCFGSLNIDYTYKVDHFVQKGETISSRDLNIFGGGKGLNQSIALAKAGMEVYHAGAVGTDGGFLLEQMEKEGVHTEHVMTLKEIRTGNAIIQNDKDGDNCIILYGGANQAITTGHVDKVLSHFQEGDYVLLQNETNQLSYMIQQAHKTGMKIILNPSPINEKILALPLDLVNYFILNEIEARQMLGIRNSQEMAGEEMAGLIHKKYPWAVIVLTLGEEGSVYVDRDTIIYQKKYDVQAVDTIAAGDTFTGFFLGGILQGRTKEEAMDMAAKASAIAVTRYGASSSIPEMDEVLRFETD